MFLLLLKLALQITVQIQPHCNPHVIKWIKFSCSEGSGWSRNGPQTSPVHLPSSPQGLLEPLWNDMHLCTNLASVWLPWIKFLSSLAHLILNCTINVPKPDWSLLKEGFPLPAKLRTNSCYWHWWSRTGLSYHSLTLHLTEGKTIPAFQTFPHFSD